MVERIFTDGFRVEIITNRRNFIPEKEVSFRQNSCACRMSSTTELPTAEQTSRVLTSNSCLSTAELIVL